MKQAKLQLAQAQISRASHGAGTCPLAQMLNDNGFPQARVGKIGWRAAWQSDRRIFHTPSMSLIVRKFDSGKPIRPCIILVNMP